MRRVGQPFHYQRLYPVQKRPQQVLFVVICKIKSLKSHFLQTGLHTIAPYIISKLHTIAPYIITQFDTKEERNNFYSRKDRNIPQPKEDKNNLQHGIQHIQCLSSTSFLFVVANDGTHKSNSITWPNQKRDQI